MTFGARTVQLASMTTWLSGGTPNRVNPSYWNGTIPWISAATLKRTQVNSSDQHLTEAGVRAGSKLAPTGATLVLVRGMALHHEVRIGMATRPVSFNQDVKALIPKRGLLPDFLVYSLQARSKQILDLVSSAGSGTGVLNTQLLQRLPIWIPNEISQSEIVHAIKSTDQSIDAIERLITKRQAIKQSLIQRHLANNNQISNWPLSRLSELVDELQAGVSVRSSKNASHGVAVLKTSSINKGRFDPTEAKPVLPADIDRVRCSPVAGSLIISRMNTPSLVGEVGYVEHDYTHLYLPDRLWLAQPKKGESQKVNMRWLGYYLSSTPGSARIRELATGTSSSMKNIPKNRLLSLEIPTPPLPEQDAIVQVIINSENELDALHRKLTKIRNIKKGMMQELLTGRAHLSLEGDVV